jgi:endonuclease-3
MKRLTKTKREQLIADMLKAYPDAHCALNFENNYQLLVAVVLSAQATDNSVNKVTPKLFKKAPTPEAMLKLGQEKLEKHIRSIGLYRSKAKHIMELSRQLIENFNGEVPGNLDDLITLSGVGRKTANVMLSTAFGQQAIAVDTHVFRLANRTGLAGADNVIDTELQLQKAIPYDSWTKMHHALIWHGRLVCKARNPECEICCINTSCMKNGLS